MHKSRVPLMGIPCTKGKAGCRKTQRKAHTNVSPTYAGKLGWKQLLLDKLNAYHPYVQGSWKARAENG